MFDYFQYLLPPSIYNTLKYKENLAINKLEIFYEVADYFVKLNTKKIFFCEYISVASKNVK